MGWGRGNLGRLTLAPLTSAPPLHGPPLLFSLCPPSFPPPAHTDLLVPPRPEPRTRLPLLTYDACEPRLGAATSAPAAPAAGTAALCKRAPAATGEFRTSVGPCICPERTSRSAAPRWFWPHCCWVCCCYPRPGEVSARSQRFAANSS